MGGTNGVSGSGNNFQVPNFWSKPSLKNAEQVQTNVAAPINMKFGNVDRNELGFINPYNGFDIDTSGMKEIVAKSNEIMEKLGYSNFKVTPKAVASVTKSVNEQTIPGLNLADDNAVAARVASPKGPFADLFV